MKANRRTPLMVGAGGALLVLIVIGGLLLPKAGQVRSRQADLEKARQDQSALMVRVEVLRAAAKEGPANRRRLAKLGREVPETVELSSIIRILNSAADQSAVDFVSIAPSQPLLRPEGTSSSVATQITVDGSYFSIDEFLFRIESLLRVAKVTQIAMTPSSTSGSGLSINLTAEFYTTDLSAGPGSEPGSTKATGTQVSVPVPAPAGTTSSS
jgi:Tfp pilus assembly protein PilO